MDQATAKNQEDIKKLRRDVKSLHQSVDMARQNIDAVHQTLTSGIQKVLSEIERLKIENVKIKSNLKYLMNSKTNPSGDSNIFSEPETRTTSWVKSMRSAPGNQFNLPSYRKRSQSDLSSDDTDVDRATLITDHSLEEDTSPRLKKDRRKQHHNALPPKTETANLTSEISSSESEIRKAKTLPNHMSATEPKQNNIPGSGGNGRTSPVPNVQRQNSIETDQHRVPVQESLFNANLSQKNGATGTSRDERLNGASSSYVLQNNDTVDLGEESEEDTDITMTVESKLSVTYPHTVPDYKPVMVPYNQIKFNDGKDYLKSLGFIITDPNVKEFIYKVAALDSKKNDQLPKGLYTLLLLDTSYSTGPGGLLETRKFVNEFLDEIETATEYNLEEMVGVFEFGSHAGILHEFTNDYSLIRECLDNIDVCAGRTNLWSALLGVLCYCHKKAKKCTINGRTHGVRVVMVSDGNVTDEINFLSNCENEADLERIEDRIMKFMPYLLREKFILTAVEIGMDSEERFLRKFAKKGKGQYGQALWSKYVGRYYLYQTIIGKMLPELRDQKNRGNIKELLDKHTTEYDYFNKTDVAEISILLRDRYKFEVPEELFEREPLPEYDDDYRVTLYTTEFFSRLPPIGTRVKPGSKFKDTHKEPYKNGTVVAHCKRNTMVVKWDEKPTKIHFYKYETENHEVDKMYMYRKIDMTIPGYIDTGCRVIRGVHWNKGDEDGGRRSIGTVVRKHAKQWVTVKWPNGTRERYRFGADDCFDLEIIDEEERINRGLKELVIQYQFKDDSPTEWRTLDEEANNTVLNHIDTQRGRRGIVMTLHHGIGYNFDLDKMEYVNVNDSSIKGEIKLLRMSVPEQDDLRKKEWELYKEKKMRAQQAQAGGAGGMDFLAQLQQGGGRGGMNLLNQMAQGGGGGLAGLMGQGGMGGQGLAGMMGQAGMGGQGLAGLMGQGGLGGGQGGQGLAGMMGQGGQGLAGMMGQGGQGLGGMMGQGQGLGGMMGQGGQGLGGMMGQGGQGFGGISGQGGQGFGGMGGGGGPKWNCAQCTYENGPNSLQCEMCQAAKA
ncbi:uncharacterized protein LOC127734815 isoform X1 [Mytilus californianus]|uniref:uncharacterized protein LOC127734815 isoform X1 n=2 Tax=Mytilus californianus TaxID=6549 RepID=UPI00224758DC|nr:uncharacterized protein LOC127734815 isoform X1 [Mytilus californianus]